MTKPIELTTANFDQSVLSSDKLVLVDFWATWCNPCKMIAPFVEQIAEEHAENVVVGKLDADAHGDIVNKYQIMGLPTLVLFKNGQPVARLTGFQTKDKIVREIQQHL
jgi:thioredoxin 1